MFELKSIPTDRQKEKGRLFLVQLPQKVDRFAPVDVPTCIARLDGANTRFVAEALFPLVSGLTGAPSDADSLIAEQSTVLVPEDVAARMALVFATVNTLRAGERAQQVVQGIAEMDDVDVAFWYNKTSGDGADNGRRALIVLLTGSI